jgi:ergothioneine biosynthesis protein EgtB
VTHAQPNAASTSPLERRYRAARARSLELVAPLSPEDCQAQSMPDASPAKWHLAHTTWFFETFVLEPFERGFAPFDASFRVLFNSYYHGIGERHPRPQRGLLTRPPLDVVKRWRAEVDARVAAVLSAGDPDVAALVVLGLHHEQQHQELMLTDLKHLLSLNPQRPAYGARWPMVQVQPQPLRWFGYAGGLVDVGHEAADDGAFAFDNESPRHRTYLQPFELASRPVTHGECCAFIDDGGYRRPELWLSAGWDWLQAEQREAPLYWEQRDGSWWTFTLHGMVPIDQHTPAVHLSYYEADAFARWAGARLPTEAEWEHAARALPRLPAGNFADTRAFHPMPQREAADLQPLQMYGDVWEWTSSDYAPYPGYRPAEGAVGEYNGKFMSGQYVLRGGSCATPSGHVRASYRNFFPPSAQWQFSGLRLAR